MPFSRVVRRVGTALLAFSFLSVAAPAAHAQCYAPYCWGAIAINTHTGQWGWSVNHGTQGEARAAANARCGYRCNRVLSFRNTCGAYATPATLSGGYGWATRYNRYAAEAEALRQCRLYNPGQGCRVRVWACTSRQ